MSSKVKKKSSAKPKKKPSAATPFFGKKPNTDSLFQAPDGQPTLAKESAAERRASWIYLFLAFFIPFILMFIAFKIAGVSPFGTNMILATDAWHQYYPFLVDYQDKLQHGGSLLWTWKSGGGTNYVALMAYYLASPLNFFSVLVPAEKLREFLYIITCVKIGLAGLFYALFLRITFKRRDASLTAFGIMYALCAFIMGYYWNVIWLDTIALLPLVIAGTIALLKDGKFRLYIIALALSILANYYIGLFTCIFVFFVSLGYCIVEFKGWKDLLFRFLRMLGCSLVGIMMSAILTLPTYFALKYTYSSENTFPKQFSINIGSTPNFAGVLEGMGKTIANSVAFTEPTAKEGLPNIYCGVFVIFLALLFFFCSKIKLRERLFCGLLMLFFMVSFIIRQLDYIWHGFHFPNMLPHRFSFLYSFVLIYMAFRVFMYIDDLKLASVFGGIAAFAVYMGVVYTYFNVNNSAKQTALFEGAKSAQITKPIYAFLFVAIITVASILLFSFSKRMPPVLLIVGCGVIGVIAVLLFPLFKKKVDATPFTLSLYLGGITAAWVLLYVLRRQIDTRALAFSFASVGLAIALVLFNSGSLIYALTNQKEEDGHVYLKLGIFRPELYKFLGVLVILLTAAATFLIFWQKINIDHRLTKVLVSVFILFIALVEGIFSAAAGVKVVGVTDAKSYPAGGNDTMNCVARINELEKDNIDLPHAEVNKYWSLNDNALIGTDGISMFNSMGNMSITAYMEKFGICGWIESNRYTYQESSPFTNLMLNMKYIIAPYGAYLDSTHNDLIYESGTVKLMQNKDYVPQGFMVNSKLADFDVKSALANPMENQNEMFRKATGLSGNIYEYLTSTSATASANATTVTNTNTGYFTYSSTLGNESYDINYTAPKTGVATAYLSANTDNVSIRVNGQEKIGYYIKRPFIMMVGNVNQGDTITLHITMKNSTSGTITSYCAMFNEELFQQGRSRIAQSVLNASKVTDTCIEGTINAQEDGLFYTSISYSKGWKATVDGKEVEITPVGNAMLAFPLSAGSHTIKLTYIPEGFVKGVLVTVFGLLIFIAMIILAPKKEQIYAAVKQKIGKKQADSTAAADSESVKAAAANKETADDSAAEVAGEPVTELADEPVTELADEPVTEIADDEKTSS